MLNDPTISVTCDTCGTTFDDLEMTPLAGGGWDARNIPAMLKRYNWKVDGDTHTCDDCLFYSLQEGGE